MRRWADEPTDAPFAKWRARQMEAANESANENGEWVGGRVQYPHTRVLYRMVHTGERCIRCQTPHCKAAVSRWKTSFRIRRSNPKKNRKEVWKLFFEGKASFLALGGERITRGNRTVPWTTTRYSKRIAVSELQATSQWSALSVVAQ